MPINSVTIASPSGPTAYYVPDWISDLRDGIYGFYWKGSFFAFGISIDGDTVTQCAFVSTDNGATWTGPLDPTHAPSNTDASTDQRSIVDISFDNELFPGSVSKVTVMAGISYDPVSGNTFFSFFDFDLTAKTWGAAYGTVPLDASLPLNIGFSSQNGSSTPVVFYAFDGTSPYDSVSTITGASSVIGAANPGPRNLVVDQTGTAYVIPFPPSLAAYISPDAGFPLTGNLRIIENRLAIPSAPGGALAVYTSPLGSLSWTPDTTPGTAPGFGIEMPPWLLEDCCGNIVVFWSGDDGASIMMSVKTGGFDAAPPGSGWSAPVVVYSIATDTNPDVSGKVIFYMRANRNPNIGGIDFIGQVNDPTFSNPVLIAFHISGSLCASCAGLASGAVGVPYSQYIEACVGSATPTFAVTAGSLPPGLTLNASTGVISGTPTMGGIYPFTVQVSVDSVPFTSVDCSITIAGGSLAIDCASPPDGVVGVPYSHTIPATGGTAPYTFAITSGSLPTGLTLNSSTGVISGTPTTAETSPFTVQVTDSAAGTASADCSITVTSSLSISCNYPGDGVVGTSYSQTFLVTGGTAPFTFAITDGSPPTGTTLDTESGTLIGTPTAAGTFAFTVQVTDADSNTATADCSDTIVGGPVSINCGTPPPGQVGVFYTYTFPNAGGILPYIFSITSGSLPPGLTLNSVTGVVSGTPTTAGVYPFTIGVTPSFALAITSGPPPSGITGTAYSFTFTSSGGNGAVTWSSTGTLPTGLSLSGAVLSGTPTVANTFSFTITATDSLGATISANYTVSITTFVPPDWSTAIGAMPHALIFDGSYVWAGGETIPGVLTRLDPSTGAATALTFPDDNKHQWLMDAIYLPSKGKVYCLFGHPYDNGIMWATVSEVDPATLTWTDVISDDTYNPEQGSLCADSSNLYIVARLTNLIARYDLSTWAANGTLSLASMPEPHCVRYDPINNKIFATAANLDNPSLNNICRIDPVTFTVEQYGFTPDSILTDDLAMTTDYVWCGSEQTGKITRFSKLDLTSQTTVTITEMAGQKCYGVYWDGTSIWACFTSTPGKIAQIDPTALTYTLDTMPFSTPNEIWSDNNTTGQAGLPPAGSPTKLFLTSYLSPGEAYSYTLP